MELQGIDFGPVWGASGVQGFFGEGYWFHKWWRPFGLDFRGATFVAKTTTLERRAGNMPLDMSFRPRELFPICVIVKPVRGVVLNAVGLSGPGARMLLEKGVWQERRDPFFISFMSIEETASERIRELVEFVNILRPYLPRFRAPVGLQINFSCPNVGLHLEGLTAEVYSALKIASTLGVPVVPKFNALLPVQLAREFSDHPACDGLCVTNAIPYGSFPHVIDWEGFFGKEGSPLADFGGGGLSGKPLLPILIRWLREARLKGRITKPINAGGGILSIRDAEEVMRSGASSISLGSVALLRPWRVRRIISYMRARKPY